MVDWKIFLQGVIPLPQRIILSIMCFLGIINAYTMRICLSIAIVDMVNKTYHNETGFDDEDFCPLPEDHKLNTSASGEYEWSEELQGVILSSFFWGYIISHLPGGTYSEKFGGKYVLSIGILATSILTLITPLVIDAGGPYALIGVRFLEGLSQGTLFPAITAILAMWVPLSERSKLGSIVFGAEQVGIIVGTLISGFLIDYYANWRAVFYFFGITGIIWFFFFTVMCFSDPDSHPYITEKEKNFLHKEMGQLKRDNNLSATPWKLILTNIPVIALICGQFNDFGFYIMVADLPKYMADVLHFDIQQNSLYSSLPYVVMWLVSIGAGFLGDFLITKNHISVTNSRKLFTTLSSAVPAIFIVAASYAGCDRIAVVILFTIGMGIMGTYYAGMRLNCLDLSPNYAGTLMAITNGVGAVTGIIGPYIVGVLTPNRSLSEWRLVFWIAFAVFMITNLIYIIWASSDIQPFDTYFIVSQKHECIEIRKIDDNFMETTNDNISEKSKGGKQCS